jgi:hypothetical protein
MSLKMVGGIQIATLIFSVLVDISVIEKWIPYTWINDDRTSSFADCVQVAKIDIPIMLLILLIFVLATQVSVHKLPGKLHVGLYYVQLALIVISCIGLGQQLLGTLFEKLVMAPVMLISVIASYQIIRKYKEQFYFVEDEFDGSEIEIERLHDLFEHDYDDTQIYFASTNFAMKKEISLGIDALDELERRVFAVGTLLMEVNNGGFDQYFFNTEGTYAKETSLFLRELGDEEFVGLLEKAILVFESELPEEEMEKAFDQLDDQFFDIDEESYDSLYSNLSLYLRKQI